MGRRRTLPGALADLKNMHSSLPCDALVEVINKNYSITVGNTNLGIDMFYQLFYIFFIALSCVLHFSKWC
jgi:hypothetical protein